MTHVIPEAPNQYDEDDSPSPQLLQQMRDEIKNIHLGTELTEKMELNIN